ncbi:discoidin domain-containing protein [Hahella aquimaris]|uniref:discoidin domain-containing protein n=1 Tax=Hahella sp. HNIBRBA332 TaxID=3015983 RepID=UPI00273C66C1|nr:discoidin domain-containing protein [Hahella sp. HNIBRBA332]WLQ16786.1 discoidin domain-containing protein [Hahella sp. HNIBRBA332]
MNTSNIPPIPTPPCAVVRKPWRSSASALAATFALTALASAVSIAEASVTVSANGPGDTYELFSEQLGVDPETPDCGHAGRHIAEEWNAELNTHVFAFLAHVDEDDDRCINSDRQRTEVKTASSSPDNLKGTLGETHTYRWKFKLDSGFQPSSSFTHVHQIKGDGGGMPLITLTPRAGSPNKMELIHNSDSVNLGKVNIVDLEPFMGEWVEVVETSRFDDHGTYSIRIKRLRDGQELMSWSSNDIDMWLNDKPFVRPKWGIYRSLNNKSSLRDEKVLFNDFCIAEGDDQCPVNGPGDGEPDVTTIEAETANLHGQTKVLSKSFMSGGKGLGYIGNGDNWAEFRVNAKSADYYPMTLHFTSGKTRTLYWSVNGTGEDSAALNSGGWSQVKAYEDSLFLDAGDNVIRFYNASAWAPDLDKIEFGAPAGGEPPSDGGATTVTNLAQGKPVSCTDAENGNGCSRAVDGDVETRWSAKYFPQALTVDLGAKARISAVELVAYKDRAYHYVVEVSDAATGPWTQIVDRNDNATPGTIDAPTRDDVDAEGRYVRIRVNDANVYEGDWTSLLEFRVLGLPK